MDALRVQRLIATRSSGRDERREQVVSAASFQPVVVRQLKPTVAEEQLLRLLLGSEELRKIVVPRLEPTHYEGLATAALFGAISG